MEKQLNTKVAGGLRVTQIISQFNPATAFMVNEEARVRGQHVHELARLYDLDNIDLRTVDKELKPYLNGYKKFLEDFEPEWDKEFIEQRIANSSYTGRLDRYGIIRKKRAVVDFKAGAIQVGYCGLQLSAYANLLGWKVDIGYAVQLQPETYSVAWYPQKDLRRYFNYFQSMANTYHFISNGFKL